MDRIDLDADAAEPVAEEPVAGAGDLLVPEGTRLLHIGPHKTATTALQGALWAARDDLLLQGVRHAGRSRNPSTAVRAVTRQGSGYSDDPPPMRHWRDLVREIRGAREPRLIVSSEFLAAARPEVIRRIVDELDPSRVRIVVTARPLARILPSTWQQNVQGGAVASLDAWTESLLTGKRARPDASFWSVQRHDRLVERWMDVVGRERVTVVVVNDRDHGFVLRAFEGLLGLREGTLRPIDDLANRSLTAAEAEAIRAFNIGFRRAGGGRAVHAVVMRLGAAQQMKRRRPAPDEPRVVLPDWAREQVARVSGEVADGVVAAGVRIVGDPRLLREVPAAGATAGASTAGIPLPVAAAMALGVLVSTGAARGRAADALGTAIDPDVIGRVPTYQISGTVAMRAALTAPNAWRAARRAVRRRSGAVTGGGSGPVGRPLEPAEVEAIEAFSLAYGAAGLDPARLGRLVEAASHQLRQDGLPDSSADGTGQEAPGSRANRPGGPGSTALIPAGVAASVAIGILVEQGMLPERLPEPPSGAPRTARERRLDWGPARRAWLRAEPVEIVSVPSRTLVTELARRLRPASASRRRRRDGGLTED